MKHWRRKELTRKGKKSIMYKAIMNQFLDCIMLFNLNRVFILPKPKAE